VAESEECGRDVEWRSVLTTGGGLTTGFDLAVDRRVDLGRSTARRDES
jgi:hypothetical protein